MGERVLTVTAVLALALTLGSCGRKEAAPAPDEKVAQATPTEAPAVEDTQAAAVPAMVGAVEIQPRDFNARSTVRAVVSSDPAYVLRYEWEVNDRGFGLTDSDTFDGPFRRGDQVRVTVTPYNAGVSGIPMASKKVRVNNAPPEFKGALGQGFQLDGYTFPVEDPDGDTLSFSLAGAPPGLRIDPAAGRLSYTPSTTVDPTEYRTTVIVSDGEGGEVKVSFPVKVQ